MTTFTTSEPELTANDYYQRDADYGINNENTLNKHLEKLGLKDFDVNNEINKYMNWEISLYVNNHLDTDINIDEISENIRSSNKFRNYTTFLYNQNIRKSVLGNATYEEFYHLCTPDELVYLGW